MKKSQLTHTLRLSITTARREILNTVADICHKNREEKICMKQKSFKRVAFETVSFERVRNVSNVFETRPVLRPVRNC